MRRAADLARVDVHATLLGGLDWSQRRSLDELAPTHWTTASGRRVRLRYGTLDGEAATVSASLPLRDLLGTDIHPTVGPGRHPVTLELLSPAGRPVQRTTDLPGFWRGSYGSVRAELRGRYPKHPWPERPWEPLPPSGRRR
jgi:ATP-dependent helicase HrpB